MRFAVRVAVQHRIRGDGRIWVDGVKTKVRRDTGGRYAVFGLNDWENARVLFRPFQDLAIIEQYGRFLRLSFHAGEGTFEWEGRAYHVGTMIQGLLRIGREERPVASGVVTVSGIRLDEVASELLAVIRPLAWALCLRSEEIRKG